MFNFEKEFNLNNEERKLTQEKCNEILLKHGLYTKDIYKNNRTNMNMFDDKGYKYFLRLGNFKENYTPMKFHKNNPYTINNIKNYIKLNCNNLSTLISDTYIKNSKPLKFKCKKCGKIYFKSWADFQNSKTYVCKECIRKNISDEQKLNFDDVKKYFLSQGLIVLDNNYINNSTNLNVIDLEGYKGKISISNLKKGKHFYKFSTIFNEENFISNLNNFSKINGINSKAIKIVSKNDYGHTRIEFKCECGETFIAYSCDFIAKIKNRCRVCTNDITKIEYLTKEFLDKNNIEYIMEHTFKNCKKNNKRPYFFDFYLLQYNCCIECDGRQHFEKVNFGGISDEEAINNLKETQKSDKIKDFYCQKNNINMIRIPYWDFDNKNYINILNKKLNIC